MSGRRTPSPPTFAKRSLRSRLRLAGRVTRAIAKVVRRSLGEGGPQSSQETTATTDSSPAFHSPTSDRTLAPLPRLHRTPRGLFAATAVFATAKLDGAHSHRFRDPFAV